MNGTLGSRVRQIRKQCGLTQIQLADSIYVTESYIALIEADKRNPSMDVIGKLSEQLHVTTDYLVNGDLSDTDRLMIKEWTDIVKDRSPEEIRRAISIVKHFFNNVDELSD